VSYGNAIVVDDLAGVALSPTRQPIYDQDFDLLLLHRDERTGAEHYLIRYPPGLNAQSHRHTAAHTMVLIEGAMRVNGREVRAPSYIHFPGGELMHHAPAEGAGCQFVLIFDGPFDLLQ
jgi:hypothetical protein